MNLTGAVLGRTDVAHARLDGADLSDANPLHLLGLAAAICDEGTDLPEGWTCRRTRPVLAKDDTDGE